MTLAETVTYLLKKQLQSPSEWIDFEKERRQRQKDPIYNNNEYVSRLMALCEHEYEILDALLDATSHKPNSFRAGMIPLIKEGGLLREHASHMFKTYIAPVVADSWYPHNRHQFVRGVLHAVRESPYGAAITTINTWGKGVTHNPLWNISERIIQHYTEEIHRAYMNEIQRICNF